MWHYLEEVLTSMHNGGFLKSQSGLNTLHPPPNGLIQLHCGVSIAMEEKKSLGVDVIANR